MRLRLELAVGFFRERAHLVGADVAGNHQDRVVRRIVPAIESDRVVAVEQTNLVLPADHRPAVGMIDEERGLRRLGELRAGIVVGARTALLQHDLALRQHVGVGEHQAGHAIGFEFHQCAQMLARNALEIGGVIGPGERVLLPADGGDDLGEFAARILGRALEHQVFEEMRDARLALFFVRGADAIPDHVRDHRRAAVGDHDHLESVAEHEAGDLGPGRRRGRRRYGDRGGSGDGERGNGLHQ